MSDWLPWAVAGTAVFLLGAAITVFAVVLWAIARADEDEELRTRRFAGRNTQAPGAGDRLPHAGRPANPVRPRPAPGFDWDRHEEELATCWHCQDTGWVSTVTPGGDGYTIPCPEGCPR